MTSAIDESINHWVRMISYVEGNYDLNAKPDDEELEEDLGETYNGSYCSLCNIYSCSCDEDIDCPLALHYWHCFSRESEFDMCWDADTWTEWLDHAKKLLEQLKSLKQETE